MSSENTHEDFEMDLLSCSEHGLSQLSLQIHSFDYSENIRHWPSSELQSDDWQLFWHPIPGASITYNERRYSLFPDSCFLVAPQTRLSSQVDGSPDHLSISFKVSSPIDMFDPGVYSFKVSFALSEKLNKLKAYCLKPEDDQPIRRSMLIYSIICDVLAKLNYNELPLEISDKRIRKAIQIIRSENYKSLSNNDLAKSLNMSTNYFINYFKQETGETPQAYILRQKLEKVAYYLEHTTMPLETISERCGFCNRHYMSRQFIRQYKIGPAKYRKQSFL